MSRACNAITAVLLAICTACDSPLSAPVQTNGCAQAEHDADAQYGTPTSQRHGSDSKFNGNPFDVLTWKLSATDSLSKEFVHTPDGACLILESVVD